MVTKKTATTKSTSPTLLDKLGHHVPGDKRSDRVAIAQHLLGYHGFHVKANGLMDATTELLVAEFQEKMQIPVSGEIDAKTWEALLLRK